MNFAAAAVTASSCGKTLKRTKAIPGAIQPAMLDRHLGRAAYRRRAAQCGRGRRRIGNTQPQMPVGGDRMYIAVDRSTQRFAAQRPVTARGDSGADCIGVKLAGFWDRDNRVRAARAYVSAIASAPISSAAIAGGGARTARRRWRRRAAARAKYATNESFLSPIQPRPDRSVSYQQYRSTTFVVGFGCPSFSVCARTRPERFRPRQARRRCASMSYRPA